MSIDPSGNEFARQPVPASVSISGWRIALIKVGVLIALPAFIMGAELGFRLGYVRSMLAFLCGAAILFVLALGTATVGAKTRLSTAMLIQFTFGRVGAKAVSLALAGTLIGWFGVTAELFGESLSEVAVQALDLHLGATPYIVLGGTVMVLTTVFGIRGLQRLADLAVPLLLAGLATVAWLGYRKAGPAALLAVPDDHVSLGVGISAVVGSMAAGVSILPDVCRFARNPAHGRLAAFLTLGVGVPLVLGLSALPSVATGEGNLINVMLGLGLGVPAVLLLVFTAWTTNTGNLYSSSLMIGTVAEVLRHRLLVVIVGVVGTGLAVSGITEYLIPVLLLVGFLIPPIASIYITDFFLVRRGEINIDDWEDVPEFRVAALAAWSSGVAVALLTSNSSLTFTSIPACDSIVTALVVYVALYYFGVGRDDYLGTTGCGRRYVRNGQGQ